jgi:hypothetical protein
MSTPRCGSLRRSGAFRKVEAFENEFLGQSLFGAPGTTITCCGGTQAVAAYAHVLLVETAFGDSVGGGCVFAGAVDHQHCSCRSG